MGKEVRVKTDRRIYRTRDGRLVWQGDPDAAFLMYPAGREVPRSVLERVGVKQGKKPLDKQAEKPADKASGLSVQRLPKRPPASGPGSGAEAWREYAAAVTGESPESLADLSRDELIDRVE